MSDKLDYHQNTDGELVAMTLAGDQSAYGKLAEKYYDIASAVAMARLRGDGEVEDLVQDSFIKAFRNLDKLRSPERFGGWLTRIVQQGCVDHLRKKRVRAVVDHRECLDHVPAPVMGNPGLTDEHRRFVRDAVGRLKEKYQTVIVMRFVGGLNASEIAMQLGKKPGTVRVWLHRAYAMLRESLAPIVQEVSL